MDSEQVIRIALTVVTPILTAGIGIVALVIGDWRERRTKHGLRKLSFEDASRQVEFAADWFKASKEIAPEEERQAAARAQAWLEEASDLVADTKPAPPDEEKRSVTVRRLLLAYPMHRRGARVLRGFYYFFLGVVVFQVSGALGAAFGRTDTIGVPNYFSGGLIYADLLGIFLYTLIAMGFRFWSLRAEEAQSDDSPRQRMTVRDAIAVLRVQRDSRPHCAGRLLDLAGARRGGHSGNRDERFPGPAHPAVQRRRTHRLVRMGCRTAVLGGITQRARRGQVGDRLGRVAVERCCERLGRGRRSAVSAPREQAGRRACWPRRRTCR